MCTLLWFFLSFSDQLIDFKGHNSSDMLAFSNSLLLSRHHGTVLSIIFISIVVLLIYFTCLHFRHYLVDKMIASAATCAFIAKLLTSELFGSELFIKVSAKLCAANLNLTFR